MLGTELGVNKKYTFLTSQRVMLGGGPEEAGYERGLRGAQAVSGWEGGSWEAPKKSSLGRPLKIIGRTWKNTFEGQAPAGVGVRGCHPEAQHR